MKNINLENDKDFQKKLQKGFKRLALVACLWSLIPTPILFIVPNENIFLVTLTWMVWVILGVRLSPKIVNKVWSNDI